MTIQNLRRKRIMRGEIIITRKTETQSPTSGTAIKALSWVGVLLLTAWITIQWIPIVIRSLVGG